jgi:hypothetical protein
MDLAKNRYTYRFCIDQNDSTSPTVSKTASSLPTTNAGSFNLEYNYLSSLHSPMPRWDL